MAEPLFFDCLTDAQFWSLFDSGVLHAYMLPGQVFQRLERLALAHGCYLFAWPAGLPLPVLEDIIPCLVMYGDESPLQAPSRGFQMPASIERVRMEIEAFCARVHTEMPIAGGRIHIITVTPDIQLRAGPYLEPAAHDIASMSMPELEAYLDALLRLDDDNDLGAAASDTYGPPINRPGHAPPWVSGSDVARPV
jgi:hypothetical protein